MSLLEAFMHKNLSDPLVNGRHFKSAKIKYSLKKKKAENSLNIFCIFIRQLLKNFLWPQISSCYSIAICVYAKESFPRGPYISKTKFANWQNQYVYL